MKKHWLSLVMVITLSLAFGLQSVIGAAALAGEPSAFGHKNGKVEINWSAYGRPLSADEMAAVDGELGCLITGAIIGAVGAFFEYIISDEDPTIGEMVETVGTAALLGAVSSGLAVVGGASAAFSWSQLGWGVWGAAHVGSFTGYIDRLLDEF